MSGNVHHSQGGASRPAWSYQGRGGVWMSQAQAELEMMESSRNVLEAILLELRSLNRLLACPNFIGIPASLRKIVKNTTKKPRKVKVGA